MLKHFSAGKCSLQTTVDKDTLKCEPSLQPPGLSLTSWRGLKRKLKASPVHVLKRGRSRARDDKTHLVFPQKNVKKDTQFELKISHRHRDACMVLNTNTICAIGLLLLFNSTRLLVEQFQVSYEAWYKVKAEIVPKISFLNYLLGRLETKRTRPLFFCQSDMQASATMITNYDFLAAIIKQRVDWKSFSGILENGEKFAQVNGVWRRHKSLAGTWDLERWKKHGASSAKQTEACGYRRWDVTERRDGWLTVLTKDGPTEAVQGAETPTCHVVSDTDFCHVIFCKLDLNSSVYLFYALGWCGKCEYVQSRGTGGKRKGFGHPHDECLC